MNAKWMPLAVMGLCLAAPLRAADADKDKDDTAPQAATNRGTDKQLDKLSAEFKVPESEIADLRSKGLGWGEIRNALAISQKAGVPVSDVLKLRDSGMGWGRIAQKYGFKLGDVVGRNEKREGPERRDRDDGMARGRRGGDDGGRHAPAAARGHGHS